MRISSSCTIDFEDAFLNQTPPYKWPTRLLEIPRRILELITNWPASTMPSHMNGYDNRKTSCGRMKQLPQPQYWQMTYIKYTSSFTSLIFDDWSHRTDEHWLWKYNSYIHDDVIKWKHFPRCWPSVRIIHRSPVNSPHKSQWRGALMFSLIICALNKRLSKQSWVWWFETPSRSLWRHCNLICCCWSIMQRNTNANRALYKKNCH